MKNLLTLLFVLALTAGVAVAQNVNVITQEGLGGHSAGVNQTYTGGEVNKSYIRQVGDAVFTAPNPDVPANSHYIRVTQNGGGNYSNLTETGVGASATVNQDGKANSLTSVQEGDSQYPPTELNVNVRQVGTANTATIDQFAHDNNQTIIDQEGQENSATVVQGRNTGKVSITQRNLSNWASVSQYAGLAATSTATIEQTNDEFAGHNATQDMGTAGEPMDGSNVMLIQQQGGDDNTAQQTMRAKDGLFTASSNEQYIKQIGGTANLAVQVTGPNGTQDAIDNWARITQEGVQNTAYQYQYGLGNSAEVYQHGGELHVSTQTQQGMNNQSTVHQYNNAQSSTVTQTGNDHFNFANQW